MALDFTWDAAQGRYRDSAGRFLSSADVTTAVDAYLDAKQGNVADNLFDLIRGGQLNVKELQLIGEREIAKAHLAAAMAAKGGKAQMSQADYGRVGGYVKAELAHWLDLMQELASGRPLDGSVKTSLRGYMAAAANTYWRVEDLELSKRNFTECLNVLDDAAHHCIGGALPSCPSVTAQGWMPAGEFPRRGQRACHWNCKCSRRFRNPATGEVRD